MRSPYTQLYIHLVWSTWDRLPIITIDVEEPVYASIIAKSKTLNCEVLAIGGTEDHVHILLRLSSSISIAELVKQIKGASSHLISRKLEPNGFFKWQGGYGAFSLRKSEIENVSRYIRNQKEHHQKGDLWSEWEPYTRQQADSGG